MTVRGTSSTGAAAEMPLAETGELRIFAKPGGAELVEVRAEALPAGRPWRPEGEVRLAASGQDTTVVPFGKIRYLRVKNRHPGLTALCILGVVGLGYLTYVGVALSGVAEPD